eukprot:gnl/Trimastix_PCT/2567.p1 GENE.gnl/Trimastix_PCT/2567~~gnl/Trimastix_PCT/2567.p1  ORF type:complete len:344 (+),score=67.78 gnl/Trimastix_PCT/2567:32-1033(+)
MEPDKVPQPTTSMDPNPHPIHHDISDEMTQEEILNEFYQLVAPPNDMAYAVAAIKTLTNVMNRSKASTMHELDMQLRAAIETMVAKHSEPSVRSGCEIFRVYLTRTLLPMNDFESCKRKLIASANHFTTMTKTNRNKIALLGERFFFEGMTIMTHSYSRVIMQCLLRAAKTKNFRVVVSEGGPTREGLRTARELAAEQIPVSLIPDVAIGAMLPSVDIVLVGAAGVVESGGIINRIGTFPIACLAKEYKIPFYVAAESYKFARIYPLTQRDVDREINHACFHASPEHPTGPYCTYDAPCLGYTPPSYVTLLFTDLGVLTPSAVSDELIKLYHE